MGVVRRIEVSAEDRSELERIVRAASSEVRMVERARIVLCAAEGRTAEEIAGGVGCSLPTVVKPEFRMTWADLAVSGVRFGLVKRFRVAGSRDLVGTESGA